MSAIQVIDKRSPTTGQWHVSVVWLGADPLRVREDGSRISLSHSLKVGGTGQTT